MKNFGCRLVQCYEDSDVDVIECVRSKLHVPLLTVNGILVVKTMENASNVPLSILDEVMKLERSALIPIGLGNDGDLSCAVLVNVARLPPIAVARLWHWRLGHPAEEVPVKMLDEVTLYLNEDCYCCDQSKHKTGSFPRSEEHMQILRANPPFLESLL